MFFKDFFQALFQVFAITVVFHRYEKMEKNQIFIVKLMKNFAYSGDGFGEAIDNTRSVSAEPECRGNRLSMKELNQRKD